MNGLYFSSSCLQLQRQYDESLIDGVYNTEAQYIVKRIRQQWILKAINPRAQQN